MIEDKDIKRFWSKVKIGNPDECWPYLGSRFIQGYGQFKHKGISVLSHRTAWMIEHKKEIPKDMVIMHLCDVRICCNPKHLKLATQSENQQDMVSKGRDAKYMLGKKHSLEALKKISLSSKGRKANLGNKHSLCSLLKMSISHKKSYENKKEERFCKCCGIKFIGFYSKLYCSNKCRNKMKYKRILNII